MSFAEWQAKVMAYVDEHRLPETFWENLSEWNWHHLWRRRMLTPEQTANVLIRRVPEPQHAH